MGDPPDLSRLDEAFWESAAGLLLADVRPELERMALASVASAAATVPVLWDEAAIAVEAADWAGRHTYELVTGLNDNTRRLLQRTVEEFVRTPGETIGQLREGLAPAFGESRAQSIAVTETTRAYAHGKRLVQQQLERGGVRMTRIWRTSMDERVCPICGEGGLQDTPESEWARIHPPAADGPPAHPRCRCWAVLSRVKE